MSLSPDEQAYVVKTAAELLRHKHSSRLLDIVRQRLRDGDYPDERERDLDAVVLAVADTIQLQLRPPR
jgi:hypothetical protein